MSQPPAAASGRAPVSPTTDHRPPTTILQRGFTLLELMIVISIIVILAVIAMPQYQKSVTHAKETVLRDNLYQMRKAIDLYGADKGKLPQSLDDLVSAGYLRELPLDPITGEKDWMVETGEDPNSLRGAQGITNVRSASPDTSTEGKPYNEW
ncbi:MAG TPA: prepilin-type N-terminal cleavage/methylation domain-containing protein [Pyrinomonadaceae bacterium]|nr:prepilin-type N-terminal cleavage/methylation domain-containing protein [Pyrinomonadaceae bacterium]